MCGGRGSRLMGASCRNLPVFTFESELDGGRYSAEGIEKSLPNEDPEPQAKTAAGEFSICGVQRLPWGVHLTYAIAFFYGDEAKYTHQYRPIRDLELINFTSS